MLKDRNIDIIEISFVLGVGFSIIAIAGISVCLIVPLALVMSRRFAPTDSTAVRASEAEGEQQRLLNNETEGRRGESHG